MKHVVCILIAALLSGCTGIPEGISPVSSFDADRYLGKWYEIARLDHSFERGLENVTAEYSSRDDGGINVTNRGFSTNDQEWKEANGKAYFVSTPDIGHLKVSFFGPFYGAYIVLELDEKDYSYSLVTGPNRSYLWILSREPFKPEATINRLKAKAESLGCDTNELIFVSHDRTPDQ